MGLKTRKGLRSFCEELSSGMGSPGGGSASAAAGAVAASLLAMVCAVSRKNKRLEEHWKALDDLREHALGQMGTLLGLAEEDAEAYDAMVEARKNRRASGTPESIEEFEAAIERAADVPLKTASACADVLETSCKIAEIGAKSASCDIGVAVLLAESALRGAAMNVEINLRDMKDQETVSRVRASLSKEKERASSSAREALARISEALPP